MKKVVFVLMMFALTRVALAGPIYIDNNLSLNPNLTAGDQSLWVSYAYDSSIYGHSVDTQLVSGAIEFPDDVYHVDVISVVTASGNFKTFYDYAAEECSADTRDPMHTLSLNAYLIGGGDHFVYGGSIVCNFVAGKRHSTQS